MINLQKSSFQPFGFTLMELVMVILILSILAIVAAPRFLSVQDEAMKQARKEMIMNINAALNMGAVKAALEGEVKGDIEVDGEKVCIKNGYPTISQTNADCYNLFYLLSPLPDKLSLAETSCESKTNKATLNGDEIYSQKVNKARTCEHFKVRLGDDNCLIKIAESRSYPKPLITEECTQP